ncbi:MAG: alpha/beta hydrolase [Phycisphaerae bacterium]|nr:alpha/beta hydrolase [Phycisphaerae bacterium]
MPMFTTYWPPLGEASFFQQHWAVLAIALTCTALVVFVVLLLAKYVRICLNIFVDTPPPLSMGPLDFKPIHGEIVRFRSFDGTSLRGMHINTPNRKAVKGTIVFCHEYGSDMYSCARYTRPLIDAGFDVFTFDYRGHGDSSLTTPKYKPLQWPSDKELGDTLGACAYVQSCLEAEGRPRDIGLFGISRGAGSGLLAAASDSHIKAIICDGAFATDTTLTALMKRWAYIFARVKLVYEHHPDWFWSLLLWLMLIPAQRRLGCRYPSVRKALRGMPPRPIFFIHGQKDSYIREEQTRLLHGDAPEPRYLWIAENAKHNQSVIVHPGLYAQRTTAFFQRYLAGESAAEPAITAPLVTRSKEVVA